MPPKLRKTTLPSVNADISGLSEEGKFLYSLLSEKLDKILERVSEREERILQLEQENATMKRDLTRISEKVDALESYERINDIIISGDALPIVSHGENVKQVFVEMLKIKLNYVLPSDKVLSAHRLGQKPAIQGSDKRSILVKLIDGGIKRDIIQACRSSKPQGIFVRDNLTPQRAAFYYALRQVKKRNDRIEYCGSRDGRIFIWMKAANGEGRNIRVFVSSVASFKKLCSDELMIEADDFLGSDHQR